MLATCQHWIDSQFFEAHTWCPTSNSHRAQLLKRSVPSQLLTEHTGKHTHLKSCTRTWEISGSECEPQLNRPCNYIIYICHLCYKTQCWHSSKKCASVSFKSWPHSEERNSSIHDVIMTAKSWILTNSLDWIEKIDHPSMSSRFGRNSARWPYRIFNAVRTRSNSLGIKSMTKSCSQRENLEELTVAVTGWGVDTTLWTLWISNLDVVKIENPFKKTPFITEGPFAEA